MKIFLILAVILLAIILIGLIVVFFLLRKSIKEYEESGNPLCPTKVCDNGEAPTTTKPVPSD